MPDDVVPSVEPTKEVQASEVKESPKYTDKEVNDLIAAKEGSAKAKARAELLKQYGFESEDAIAELKKMRDEKMTESERMAQSLKEREEAVNAAKAEAQAARAEAEALKRGVNAERVARLVKIAGTYEGESISEKLDAALKDFPEFIAKPAPENMGKETKHEEVSDIDRLLDLARKQARLK